MLSKLSKHKHSLRQHRYRHTPLSNAQKQIRLIRFVPTEDDGELTVTLRIYNLDEAPRYTAISYTWGSAEATHGIFIDGDILHITESCWYTLWQARFHRPDKLHWIDAICINQADPNEKNRQVLIMSDIFGTAHDVLACVGRHEDDSELVLERFSCYSRDELWIPMSAHLRNRPMDRFERAVRRFSSRPYWERVWIVQELLIASRIFICCGTGIVPLRTAAGWFSCTHGLTDCPMLELLKLMDSQGRFFREDVSVSTKGFTLTSLLMLTKERQCLDPRDRIYSLVKVIAWPTALPPLTPDYNKSRAQLAAMVIDYLGVHQEEPFVDGNIIRLVLSVLKLTAQDAGLHLFKIPYEKRAENGLIIYPVPSPRAHYKICLLTGGDRCQMSIDESNGILRPLDLVSAHEPADKDDKARGHIVRYFRRSFTAQSMSDEDWFVAPPVGLSCQRVPYRHVAREEGKGNCEPERYLALWQDEKTRFAIVGQPVFAETWSRASVSASCWCCGTPGRQQSALPVECFDLYQSGESLRLFIQGEQRGELLLRKAMTFRRHQRSMWTQAMLEREKVRDLEIQETLGWLAWEEISSGREMEEVIRSEQGRTQGRRRYFEQSSSTVLEQYSRAKLNREVFERQTGRKFDFKNKDEVAKMAARHDQGMKRMTQDSRDRPEASGNTLRVRSDWEEQHRRSVESE